MSRPAFAVVFGLWIVSAHASWAQNVPAELIRYPELVVYNGAVVTMDDRGSIEQAVAVRDGKILAVGSTDRILALAGPQTRRVDLGGTKAVIPGIIDTHIHPNRSAVSNNWSLIPPEYQRLAAGAQMRKEHWTDKATALARVKEIASQMRGAEWIGISGGEVDSEVKLKMTRFDLDQVEKDRPVAILLGNWGGILNSKALNMVLDFYPRNLPGIYKDEKGTPTGWFMGTPFYLVQVEMMPQLPDAVLAGVFGKELEDTLARRGVTTFNTRLNANEIRAYKLLEQQGKMPLRMAYSHEAGRWNPMFERDLRRMMESPQWYGTDMIWLSGISIAIPDVAPNRGGMVCSSFPKLRIIDGDVYPDDGMCFWDMPDDPTRTTVRVLNRYGYRVSGVHSYGDLGVEMAADTFLEAFKESPNTGGPFAMDHSQLFNPNLIRKAKEAGMIFSMGPGMFSGRRTPISSEVYGKEVVNRMLTPVKSLIDAGVMVAMEGEGWVGESPFWGAEVFVTRKIQDGTIVGEREAIDRMTALRMMTRNAAIYVGREKELGSLEEGKWADLVVVDRNPLDPGLKDEELSDVKCLLTVVGGKVVYDAATAAPVQRSRRPPTDD
jgi:predicted amidohydrolase YtcJ